MLSVSLTQKASLFQWGDPPDGDPRQVFRSSISYTEAFEPAAGDPPVMLAWALNGESPLGQGLWEGVALATVLRRAAAEEGKDEDADAAIAEAEAAMQRAIRLKDGATGESAAAEKQAPAKKPPPPRPPSEGITQATG